MTRAGKWHVGAKDLFSLYPPNCKRRIAAKRREKWEECQRAAVASAIAELSAFKPGPDLTGEARSSAKAELEARVALLKEHAEKYEDSGPTVHAVVWHDGAVWRAALDTSDLFSEGSGEGLLADFVPMTNYRCAVHLF